MIRLRPFWRYYGSKWRAAPKYPPPRYGTIIEPFAGAAGYSLRYPDRKVILVEKYHVIAEIWRYLIAADPAEIRAIPLVDTTADLPEWVPEAARWLVGMNLAMSTFTPRTTITSSMLAYRALGKEIAGWSARLRERVASQITEIRHWRIIEGNFTVAPNVEATWFIDAPYRGKPGACYPCGSGRIDYAALARWCCVRRGQAIVCEAAGADWLPFSAFGVVRGMGGAPSREAIWVRDDSQLGQMSLNLEAA